MVLWRKKRKCLVSKISVSQEPELNWGLEVNYLKKKKKEEKIPSRPVTGLLE